MPDMDLLIEIGLEEVPASYLAPALGAWEAGLRTALGELGLNLGKTQTWGTPNRMALAAWGIPGRQADAVKEITGPPKRAAYDAEGQLTKAAIGFARGQGLAPEDLYVVQTPKGEYMAVRKQIVGRDTAELLAEMMPGLILSLPFPKTMRWGRGLVTFVRPIHWILALFGAATLPFAIGDIASADTTRGHRFLHPQPASVGGADEYEGVLAGLGVIPGVAQRQEMVRAEVDRAVASLGPGFALAPDEELVEEVANLVEAPVAIAGRFSESYLKMPEEVVITCMKDHQRYFAVRKADGALAARFVAVNNTRARDMAVVARGHERVLRARLDDARFYYDDDRKTPLAARAEALKKVVFHTLLGTSWEKVERVTALAGYTAELLAPGAENDVVRAARLAKCDLVSGVVGEFASLQGVMGRVYARLDGEPPVVCEAIYEHYLPLKSGGALPATTAGAVLAVADKIETITGCFGVGLIPTGGADPYALRRQALGVIHIIMDRGWNLDLGLLVQKALEGLAPWLKRPAGEVLSDVLEFIRLRLKNLLTGQGVSPDAAEAVLALFGAQVNAATARAQALEKAKASPDFEDLAAAFKRVANIIRKFGAEGTVSEARFVHGQERELHAAAVRLASEAGPLAEAGDFEALISLVVTIRPQVDAFFDQVLVDDPDPAVKANRLALLGMVAGLFSQVADFTKISTS